MRWPFPGSPGRSAEVKVYDGNGDRLVATVTPFPGFEGTPSVAMGDVDDDGVYDLVVGAGKDYAPEIVAYSGKADGGKRAFETELARFAAFAPDARGGVSVTASQIDGSTADNIIVGLWTRHSRARSKCSARSCRRRRARLRRCSRHSAPIPTIASA